MKTNKAELENIKAIAFDFWGVFAEMNTPMYKYMQKHNISPNKYSKEIHDLIIAYDLDKLTEKQFLQECSRVVGLEIPYSLGRYTYKKGTLNNKLIEIVKKLKTRYKIALLTNNNKAYCDEYLFKTNLDKLFDVMVISYQVGYRKPSPEIYKILIKRLNLKPKEILFVDDDPTKFPVAENLGIKTLVYSGKKANEILSQF